MNLIIHMSDNVTKTYQPCDTNLLIKCCWVQSPLGLYVCCYRGYSLLPMLPCIFYAECDRMSIHLRQDDVGGMLAASISTFCTAPSVMGMSCCHNCMVQRLQLLPILHQCSVLLVQQSMMSIGICGLDCFGSLSSQLNVRHACMAAVMCFFFRKHTIDNAATKGRLELACMLKSSKNAIS